MDVQKNRKNHVLPYHVDKIDNLIVYILSTALLELLFFLQKRTIVLIR
jgi:hypothetical protein